MEEEEEGEIKGGADEEGREVDMLENKASYRDARTHLKRNIEGGDLGRG